jgi:hypothetical protein
VVPTARPSPTAGKMPLRQVSKSGESHVMWSLIGRTVFADVNLAHRPDGAFLLRDLTAYPTVVTLGVAAVFRRPRGRALNWGID